MRHVFRVVLLAILFIVFGLSGSLTAQEPAEQWQFGWENESGLFAAYNPAGTVNPLLTIDPDFPPKGWRLTADRALAVLSVQGITGLYLLMPDTIQQILPTQDAAALLAQATTLAGWQEPYAVLVAEDGAFGTGLLINFAENRVVPLSGEVLTPIDNWRFSADGQFLRYLSRVDRDSLDWSLWERSLATGEERALHTLTSAFPTIHADRTGERWIYRTLQTESRSLIHTVVFADGTSQILAQEAVADPITTFTGYQLHLDGLLVFNAPCSVDCRIEQRPLAGGSPKNYALSNIISPQVQPLVQLDDNLLLVLIENTYLLLNAAGQ